MRHEAFRDRGAPRKAALTLALVLLSVVLSSSLAAGGKEVDEARGAVGDKEQAGRVFHLPPGLSRRGPVEALFRGSERRVPHASDPLHNR